IIKSVDKLSDESIPQHLTLTYWLISGISDKIKDLSIRKLELIRCKEKIAVLCLKSKSNLRRRMLLRNNFLFETN
ncbi:MAG: hypothetical protein MHPSP_003262, partial [Paramarteilia canceri]